MKREWLLLMWLWIAGMVVFSLVVVPTDDAVLLSDGRVVSVRFVGWHFVGCLGEKVVDGDGHHAIAFRFMLLEWLVWAIICAGIGVTVASRKPTLPGRRQALTL